MGNITFYKEIDELLKKYFYKNWMTENDWNDFVKLLDEEYGITYQKMDADLKIGIRNGYSLEFQLNTSEEILKKLTQ